MAENIVKRYEHHRNNELYVLKDRVNKIISSVLHASESIPEENTAKYFEDMLIDECEVHWVVKQKKIIFESTVEGEAICENIYCDSKPFEDLQSFLDEICDIYVEYDGYIDFEKSSVEIMLKAGENALETQIKKLEKAFCEAFPEITVIEYENSDGLIGLKIPIND